MASSVSAFDYEKTTLYKVLWKDEVEEHKITIINKAAWDAAVSNHKADKVIWNTWVDIGFMAVIIMGLRLLQYLWLIFYRRNGLELLGLM